MKINIRNIKTAIKKKEKQNYKKQKQNKQKKDDVRTR
jgi:hypothetical protein